MLLDNIHNWIPVLEILSLMSKAINGNCWNVVIDVNGINSLVVKELDSCDLY